MTGFHPQLKRRALAIDAGSVGRCTAELSAIRQLAGIRSTVLEGDVLIVDYDLRDIGLAQIEAWAERNRIALRAGFARRLQRAFWKFTERNEQENAAHSASGACCNRPPPGSA